MQCDDDALHLGVLSNVLCLCESSSVNMVLCRSFVLYWKEQALKATVLCYCFHPTQAMGGKAFCSLCWCWCCRGLEVGIYCVVLNCAKSRRRRGWRWWATALCCGDKVNTPQIRCYHSTDPRVTPSICRPVLFDAFYISAGTFYVSTRHHVGCHCYCKDLPVLARWQCGGKL